mmetsp:Transcript_62946/g.76998  ORF Transcript_62946/g.76998 Transcript_62946/m.76998 type:complete len:301 (-) Transcript_62946:22-924(-)
MKGQEGILQKLAQDLVRINGLLGQSVVSLVILLLASGLGAGCPLQEVLIGNARDGQQHCQGIEDSQALGLQHLYNLVAWEPWWNAASHSEEHANDNGRQHCYASLLMPPEELFLALSLAVLCGLGRAHRAEDAHRHDEMQVTQRTAVGELRQGLSILQGLVQIPGHSSNHHIIGLVAEISARLRGLLARDLCHSGFIGPVGGFGRDQLPNQHVSVALHTGLLGMLEDLEIFGGIAAGSGKQDIITSRVRAHQRLQVIDLVVDDHIRLLCTVVLGHLGTGEEWQLLSGRDLLELWEAGFFT